MLLHTFLSLFILDVVIEQKHSKFYVSVYDQVGVIASATGKLLNQTMLKCFLKVVDLQGEASEELQEYRNKLHQAAKIEELVEATLKTILNVRKYGK